MFRDTKLVSTFLLAGLVSACSATTATTTVATPGVPSTDRFSVATIACRGMFEERSAIQDLLLKSAQETLKRGYTHFRFVEDQPNTGDWFIAPLRREGGTWVARASCPLTGSMLKFAVVSQVLSAPGPGVQDAADLILNSGKSNRLHAALAPAI